MSECHSCSQLNIKIRTFTNFLRVTGVCCSLPWLSLEKGECSDDLLQRKTKILPLQFALHACLWAVGGSRRSWREPLQTQGEQANSTWKDHRSTRESKPQPLWDDSAKHCIILSPPKKHNLIHLLRLKNFGICNTVNPNDCISFTFASLLERPGYLHKPLPSVRFSVWLG